MKKSVAAAPIRTATCNDRAAPGAAARRVSARIVSPAHDQSAMVVSLETFVVHELTRRTGTKSQKVSPTVIGYADDFVVLDEELQAIEQAKEIIAAWLKDIGLELKPSKTQVTHTLHPY